MADVMVVVKQNENVKLTRLKKKMILRLLLVYGEVKSVGAIITKMGANDSLPLQGFRGGAYQT